MAAGCTPWRRQGDAAHQSLLHRNPRRQTWPGGAFATSSIAGGWIYAARSAGALIPEGCLIDRKGNPSRNPEDYFEGGAILPAGQQKGYGLALVAEIMAEAVLGPSTTEGNWLLLVLDTRRYREQERMYQAAEAVLEELRNCPPAPGCKRVEIPGERERDFRKESQGEIQVPERTWQQIQDLSHRLGI